jgi:biotin synthase
MVAGGREVVLGQLQPLMFLAGASATMVGNYLTTGGKPAEDDLAMIAQLGMTPRTHGPGELPDTPRPRSQQPTLAGRSED